MDHIPTEICPITDSSVTNHPNVEFKGRSYNLQISNGSYTRIILPPSFEKWKNSPFFLENKHIIAGAILNNTYPRNPNIDYISIDLDRLEDDLKQLTYPSTPQEKLDTLLNSLYKLQKYEGELIDFMPYNCSKFFYQHYFKNENELAFYMRTLFDSGYIKGEYGQSQGLPFGNFINFQLTFKGLQYYLQLKSSGIQSNKCFIAMSFNASLQPIREAIKTALVETAFKPILIDEVHYGSDQTINDAIISHLRESRFCIADFTEQRNGVYFESGFALGQNKQVIYTCRNDFFKQSHFDTNHFPHIMYDTPEELKLKLINKINAWIV